MLGRQGSRLCSSAKDATSSGSTDAFQRRRGSSWSTTVGGKGREGGATVLETGEGAWQPGRTQRDGARGTGIGHAQHAENLNCTCQTQQHKASKDTVVGILGGEACAVGACEQKHTQEAEQLCCTSHDRTGTLTATGKPGWGATLCAAKSTWTHLKKYRPCWPCWRLQLWSEKGGERSETVAQCPKRAQNVRQVGQMFQKVAK